MTRLMSTIKALEVYKKVLELDPKSLTSWGDLGFCYNNRQEYDKAIEACKKALEIDPKLPERLESSRFRLFRQRR